MKTRMAAILLCAVSVLSTFLQTAIAQTEVRQSTKDGFFKTSDGISIHYLEAGSGRPVVFIPGWTMPAWIWQKQIDELSISPFQEFRSSRTTKATKAGHPS